MHFSPLSSSTSQCSLQKNWLKHFNQKVVNWHRGCCSSDGKSHVGVNSYHDTLQRKLIYVCFLMRIFFYQTQPVLHHTHMCLETSLDLEPWIMKHIAWTIWQGEGVDFLKYWIDIFCLDVQNCAMRRPLVNRLNFLCKMLLAHSTWRYEAADYFVCSFKLEVGADNFVYNIQMPWYFLLGQNGKKVQIKSIKIHAKSGFAVKSASASWIFH